MAAPARHQSAAPYAQATKDTVTTNDGNAEATITIKLVGTVSQIQADWTTLAGTSLTANSSTIKHGNGSRNAG